MGILNSESITIKYIRVIATICIIICHVLQVYNNNYAYIFNIGVQVFFVMSGFLYGNSEVENWNSFYKKRVTKIYLLYILYVIIVYMFFYEVIPIKQLLLHMVGLGGGIPGLNHLWFVTAILICYVFTPLLQKVKQYSMICLLCILALAIIEFFIIKVKAWQFSWLLCYSIGYFYANVDSRKQILLLFFFLFSSFVCTILITWSSIVDYNSIYSIVFHVLWGVSLFCVFLKILPRCNSCILRDSFILEWLNKKSYYIYIVHHIFFLGPWAILGYVPLWLIIILILFNAILLLWLTEYIEKKILRFSL